MESVAVNLLVTAGRGVPNREDGGGGDDCVTMVAAVVGIASVVMVMFSVCRPSPIRCMLLEKCVKFHMNSKL